jgi:plastocyanin
VTGDLKVSLSVSQLTLRLNESKSVRVTLTPTSGLSGAVTLTVIGLPTGVTAQFTPSAPTLGTSPVDVDLALVTKSNMMAQSAVPLTVVAAVGGINTSAPITLDVLQEVLITIAAGVSLGTTAAPNTTAFGGTASTSVTYVAPGTKVTFLNLDSRDHEIHTNPNTVGLQHENGALVPNGTYTQALQKGTVNFRCHIHPNMMGQIVVQ